MNVLKKPVAFLILGMFFFYPVILYAQPQPVTRTEQGYTPVVPALGNAEAEDQGKEPALEPQILPPDLYNPNPLSKPDGPVPDIGSPQLSQEEKDRVVLLWEDLCEAIQYDAATGTQVGKDKGLDLLPVKGSESAQVFFEAAAGILQTLSSESDAGKKAEITQQAREVIQEAKSDKGVPIVDGLRQLWLRVGRSGVNLGTPGGVMYKPELSDPLAPKVATSIRHMSAYVKEKVSSAKENIKKNTVHETLVTIGQAAAPQTPSEVYMDSFEKDGARVLDSVEITKQMAAAHALMNPPKTLHPYLRWLLYERHMTPETVNRYVKARQKAEQIFLKAKAGEGQIRYNGKVCDVYFPLPDEMGGKYELIARNVKPK